MPETNELNNLAANEVVMPAKKSHLEAAGWLVFDKTTGATIGYIDENGNRTNY